MKKTFFLFILIFNNVHGFSQGHFFLRAGGGIVYYNGDLNDRILTHPKLVKPVITIAAGYYIFHRVSIGVHYYHGKLLGNDAYAVGSGYQLRNLNFQTWINEFSLLGELNLFPYRTKWFMNPFIAGGIGLFTFNPKGLRDGELTSLQPLGTEGQYIGGDGYPKPYKLTQAVAPLALGFYMRMTSALRLRFEICNHFTFTDYLDDTSQSYPDSTALAATPNGPVAVLFSSRKKDGKFPPEGQNRGNNLANDSYTTVTLTLVYNPWIGRLDGQRKNKNELDKCFGF